MNNNITKHVLVRFFMLAISYFIWFAMYAENNYHRQTYNLDIIPLNLFFLFFGLFLLETLRLVLKSNKEKYMANICLMVFFVLLYFILPHRTNFN